MIPSPSTSQSIQAVAPIVWYTLGGIEHPSPIPAGRDRWDVVAEAVGEQLRVEARAEEPPGYDRGTRSWTLVLTVTGQRRRRAEQMMVPVRWQ